jgi:hypothetical protein
MMIDFKPFRIALIAHPQVMHQLTTTKKHFFYKKKMLVEEN